MSMSDELVSSSIQVGSGLANLGFKVSEESIDVIARLLRFIMEQVSKKINENKVESTKLTDIKVGENKLEDLRNNARTYGESLVISNNGFTKNDAKIIAQKAKKFGIPVAFANKKDKDNVYVEVRSSDLQIFKNMCTEMMKEKLAEKPQSLGNFKVNEWEMPFITNELNQHDLSAQFGVTREGQHVCIYEKADEKAIMIARNDFVRKCNEVNKSLSFNIDGDFYIINDKISGKEISFDSSMSQSELHEHMTKEFGFDSNKANIACAKFGEEMLKGDLKQKYFSSNPMNEFSNVETNISLEGENILAKEYTCIRATPKTDSVPRLIFRDSNGDFAVLNPEKMSKNKMAEILRKELHIEDNETINAVIDKAERVTDFYIRKNEKNLTHEHEGIGITIERNSKSDFTVASTFENGESQQLTLSFSDKKTAVQKLTELYESQGISEHTAKSLAKDIVKKASLQSAEKVLQIEELKADKEYYGENSISVDITMKYGNKSTTQSINVLNPEAAKEDIMSTFNVSEEAADKVFEDTKLMITEKELELLKAKGFEKVNDAWMFDQAHDVIKKLEQNEWEVPDDIDPKTYEPDKADKENLNIASESLVHDSIKADISEIGKGEELPDIGTDKVPEMPKPKGRTK